MRTPRPLFIALIFLSVGAFHCAAQETESPAGQSWQRLLFAQLPLFGRGNWIVIADAAYPWQTAIGVETLIAGGDQVDVVRTVLDALSHSGRIAPIVYTEAELPYVSENDARGVTAYRAELAEVLRSQGDVRPLPHTQILEKLNAAGNTLHILVLKTKLAIPYGSVFLELESAYWNADAEKRLRDAMAK